MDELTVEDEVHEGEVVWMADAYILKLAELGKRVTGELPAFWPWWEQAAERTPGLETLVIEVFDGCDLAYQAARAHLQINHRLPGTGITPMAGHPEWAMEYLVRLAWSDRARCPDPAVWQRDEKLQAALGCALREFLVRMLATSRPIRASPDSEVVKMDVILVFHLV